MSPDKPDKGDSPAFVTFVSGLVMLMIIDGGGKQTIALSPLWQGVYRKAKKALLPAAQSS